MTFCLSHLFLQNLLYTTDFSEILGEFDFWAGSLFGSDVSPIITCWGRGLVEGGVAHETTLRCPQK